LEEALATHARQSGHISAEHEVTTYTQFLLNTFAFDEWGLLKGYRFSMDTYRIGSFPDIVAMKRDDEALGVGPWGDFASPEKRKKAGVR
jgi:hypothetical protein